MGLYYQSTKLLEVLQNNNCKNLWEFDNCVDMYIKTNKRNRITIIKSGHYLLLRWHGIEKSMLLTLREEYFEFSSFDVNAKLWNPEQIVNYDAIPEYLEQLKFLTPIHTLQHKNFTVFENIKDIYFKALNGGLP